MPIQFSDEFLDKWEHIIRDVAATEVPLECIKKVIFRLEGRRQRTLNLQTLRKQGLHIEEIETIVTRTLLELEDQLRDVDFLVDIGAVAELVQPETDKLLSNLK
jgi:hypothetical protein